MEDKRDLVQKIEGVVSMMKTLFCVISVVYPIFGIVAGFVLQNRKFNEEIRSIGRTCFWSGVLVIIVIGILAFILFKSISQGH